MVNYDKRIEEYKKRLILLEQEFIMTKGKIKELEDLKKESEKEKEGK